MRLINEFLLKCEPKMFGNIKRGEIESPQKAYMRERDHKLQSQVNELNQMTQDVWNQIMALIKRKKIFGGVFIYDGMDYLKIFAHEMRQIMELMDRFDIDHNLQVDYFDEDRLDKEIKEKEDI